MSIVLLGSTSGSITLQEPAVAGSNTINLPAVTGTVVVAGQNSAVTAGTAVNAATGSPTSIDFTGIPSWVKRITVMFNGLSTSGTSVVQIQLGTGSTTYTTTGYVGAYDAFSTSVGVTALTTGIGVTGQAAAQIATGMTTICLITGNTWVGQSVLGITNPAALSITGGSIALGAVLTAVRITTVNGTDTFDAGTINILYE